jgi:glycosyltransferase involved in cell wall biosynthesis
MLKPILAGLRRWDRRASRRVDRFVAISEYIRKRIRDFYDRDADVVYPPVDTEYWTPDGQSHADFDLVVSAMVPYKRVDLAVDTYSRSGRKLKVVGTGPLLAALQRRASDNVEFLCWRTNAEILELYRRCRLLVFPGEEDFGIVPVEAQACGRPVVAYAKGGVLETVRDGLTGVFFDAQTEESLGDAVERCVSARWDSGYIRAHAEHFGVERFIRDLALSIDDATSTHHLGLPGDTRPCASPGVWS